MSLIDSAPLQRPSDAYGVNVVLVMPCCTAGVQFSLTVCHGGYGHEVLRLFRCTLINATDMVMIDRVPRQWPHGTWGVNNMTDGVFVFDPATPEKEFATKYCDTIVLPSAMVRF